MVSKVAIALIENLILYRKILEVIANLNFKGKRASKYLLKGKSKDPSQGNLNLVYYIKTCVVRKRFDILRGTLKYPKP